MDALQTVIPTALAQLFRRGPLSAGKLDAAWRIAVGDALHRVSRVQLRDDGTVDVQAIDQRWQRELKRSRPMILKRLNALLGDGTIKHMTFS